ncbi:BRCA1-A complex subunit RAP80-like [Cyprinodon tularosa]|uniref:BRCA1-A complex subunit RAP80-like n=1 Tax=Cyprinodon tularosa TaxID=77115 RepID=UPI0018E23A65|nr:BRCA1-A complex subunit RAP80-like [Cyprinodon tularosa]
MRGRRGHSSSSSSVTRQQSRMALRKELIPDISVDNQQQDQSTEEVRASANSDSRDELPSLLRSTSSAREKRRKERDSQVEQKEMTEEEMMDLALQLSKQEASNTALRQQREDEDVMKAIQESMVSQKKPSLKSPNKSLLGAASTSLGSRRKLSYTNGEKLPQEGDMNSGDETITSSKKQKRSTDSSLLEMPDLSQTQNLSCQNSLCSPESFSLNLDSPQSSDSTHIDDSQLQMSPVFPLTGCKAEVHIKRLNGDLVETCKTSGFVMFSEDSIPSTQNSAQPKSPVFPQSNRVSSPKSPVFLEDEEGHGGESEQSPKFVKSQIYGRTAEHETSPNASEPPACENEEFGFSSQESFIPTLRSCPPQSPVFPKTPSDMLAINSDTDQEPAERGDECSVSPVFGSTEAQKTELQEKPGEVRGSEHDQNIPDCRKDRKSNGFQTAECNRPLSESEVNGISEGCNSAEKEVTSDMTLVWSEEDDDDETPVVSPSPVFAEQEKVVPRVSQPGSSVNDVSEAGQKCSQQPCCTSGQELYPVSRQGVTRESPPPRESSGDQMIHYYWGVPFCPRGLDPDTYTQVIVAQMEVYEKSLKQVQRGLLRKAEWGKAIQPEPEKSLSPEAPAESPQSGRPRRRGLRLRSSKRSKAPEFDEEEEKRDDDGEQEQQGKEEDEEQKDGDEEQMDTDDCEVCPETQLSDNDGTTELSLVTDHETQVSSLPKARKISVMRLNLEVVTPY